MPDHVFVITPMNDDAVTVVRDLSLCLDLFTGSYAFDEQLDVGQRSLVVEARRKIEQVYRELIDP